MDLDTRRLLNAVFAIGMLLLAFVLFLVLYPLGPILGLIVAGLAIGIYRSEERRLDALSPNPRPRPPSTYEAALAAKIAEEDRLKKEKREERLARATETTNQQIKNGDPIVNTEQHIKELARIYELEDEIQASKRSPLANDLGHRMQRERQERELERLCKEQGERLAQARVEQEMRRKGEPPWMMCMGQGPEARYVELWYPKEELESIFGKEVASRFVEIDGKLYHPDQLPPESS